MPDYVIAPAGVSAASFFSPSTIVDPAKPPALLADDIDPKTGELRGLFSFVDPVDAAIAEQFRIKQGTGAAVLDQGQRFHRIRKILDSTPRELQDEANRLLKPFIDRGDASAGVVLAEAGEDAVDLGAVYVAYTNLQTNNPAKARLP